jgi:hypothetical protein
MASRGKMVGAAVLNNGRNALGGTNIHSPLLRTTIDYILVEWLK